MKAQIIQQFGGPDVFQKVEIEKLSPQAGEVLIHVKATSVNPIDTKARSGKVAVAPALPAILHGDVSGTVIEIGEGVERFKVGDEVFGCAGGFTQTYPGALLEYMVTDERLLALKPKNINFAQAAALPLVAITAWEAVFERIAIKKGQRVLVHGGTGGVGHIVLQLATLTGAHVFSTVSNEVKASIVRDFGGEPIFYRESTVTEYVAKHTDHVGFDFVIDTVGGQNLDYSFEAAKIGGHIVSISTRSTHDLSIMHAKGLSLHVVFMLLRLLNKNFYSSCGEILEKVAALVEENKLIPLVDPTILTFDQVSEAHRHLESGEAIGKVVLVNKW